jgi:hypothetical protein
MTGQKSWGGKIGLDKFRIHQKFNVCNMSEVYNYLGESIMKTRVKITLLLAFAAIVASTQAAVITFSGPVSATNTSVLDTEWLAGGTFVEGVTYGSGVKSFTTAGGQNITLAGDNTNLGNADMPAATPAATSGWYNAGTQWNWGGPGSWDQVAWRDAMYGNLYHNNASDAARPLTLHLAGLTIGQTYVVQLYSVDGRTTDRTQAYWSSFSAGVFSGGTSGSFSENPAYKVTGTFVADATYQDIFVHATDTVGNPDTTIAVYTLYAIPPRASNPDPANGQTEVSIDKILSWSAPVDPNLDPAYTITYDVYADPNQTKVTANSSSCAYRSLGQTAATFDPTPDMVNLTTYYWKVDSHVKFDYKTDPNVLSGPIWAFTTAPFDMTPVVDAGGSIITTLELASSPNVLTLNGSVTDDGISTLTVRWEAYDVAFSGGLTSKVTFADATDPSTTVTISESGTYILNLSATDATGTVSDQIEIVVYDSDCDAAKATGTHVANYYDRNDNCVVDLSDFAVFAAEWLDSTALTESYSYASTVTAGTENALVAEYWTGVSGVDPNNLLEDPRYPASPNGSYLVVDKLSGSMSGDNYGQRIRGYIVPETGGTYTFYIASDDGSRLFLSADTTPIDTDPALGNQIAEVPNGGWTGINEWAKFPEQASEPVTLTAGQYYYVEVLHKEGTSGDHVLVGWSTDGGTTIEVIPGTVLRYALP